MGIAGVVLAAAAAAQALAGPGYDLKTWSTGDGLPSDAVIALAQTPDGYLWIDTNAGLARFDGVKFTVFDRRTTPELSGEQCAPLVVDKMGALWIGTMGGGLARYANGKFEGWGRPEGSTFEYPLTILPVLGGGVWIGTNDRLHVFENGRFRVLGPEDGVTLSRPQPTHEAAGGVWVQGDFGRTGVFRNGTFSEDPGVGVLYPRTVDRPARAYRGLDFTGWYSQYRPVSVTRWGLGGTQTYDLHVADQRYGVTLIVPLARDTAWVGLRQGGLRLVGGDTMAAIGAAEGLPDGPVAAMLRDREGNLWVGTSGGLTRASPKSFSSLPSGSGLDTERTWAVIEDRRGDVWFGTDLYLWRLHEGKLLRYSNADGLPSLGVVSFAEDAKGNLWIGAAGGLARFDGTRITPVEIEGLPRPNVRALFVDRQDRLWAGTTHGLAVMEGDRPRVYTAADGLAGDWVRFIFQDSAGDMWIATTSGASRLRDGTFTTFRSADGLADDRVLTIREDEDGGVWLGTYRGGLSRFKDGTFAQVSTKNGLYDDTILQILDDGRGNFWMSSAHGVFRVARRELDAVADGKATLVTSVVYGKEDGLPTPDMGGGTQPAGWRAKDGRLWFPTGRGPTVVDPGALRVNDVAPAVIVESVLYDRVHPGGVSSAVLPPGSKTLEFHYTATALSAPERTRFRYRLEPFEGDWVDAGSRRVAYYTSLRPGRYRFHVTAANESGVWNETGAVYDLRVEPHFYETVPFYAAVVGLVALAVWGTTRLRIRQIEGRHAAVLAERGRIARELHDTVAQGFTGVSMQLEAVSARLGDPMGAREHLDRARTLVRESLADARRSVRALRPAVLESKDLGSSLKAVAAGLTEGAGITATVAASGERLPAEIEDALFRVGQEAMTNAIRHGKCKALQVDLRVENGAAALTVEDDGTGFDPSATVAGSGLTGMRERIAKLRGSLTVEGAAPHGTRVIARVPLA